MRPTIPLYIAVAILIVTAIVVEVRARRRAASKLGKSWRAPEKMPDSESPYTRSLTREETLADIQRRLDDDEHRVGGIGA